VGSFLSVLVRMYIYIYTQIHVCMYIYVYMFFSVDKIFGSILSVLVLLFFEDYKEVFSHYAFLPRIFFGQPILDRYQLTSLT
jgi:hypothetical protein